MANLIGKAQIVDGELELIDNSGNVIQLQDGQVLQLDGDLSVTVKNTDGVLTLVDNDGNVIVVNDGDIIELQDNLNSNLTENILNETNVEADTRDKIEETDNQENDTENNTSSQVNEELVDNKDTNNDNIDDTEVEIQDENDNTQEQEVAQENSDTLEENNTQNETTPVNDTNNQTQENNNLPINNPEQLPTGTTVEDIGQGNSVVKLPTGQEIIVNNQNPLTVDNTVTNDNQDFQENTLDTNTLDLLENGLGNEEGLVNQDNDNNETKEQEIQSDSSHTRILDRNADIIDVQATLREAVRETVETNNVEFEDVEPFTSATISLSGMTLVKEGNLVSYTLTDAPTSDITVTFSFSGVATENVDYTPTYTVDIPSGSKSFTFQIPTTDDYIREGVSLIL